MDFELKCSASAFDIRDYTLIDALGRIGNARGEDFKFAIWNYKESEEVIYEENQWKTRKDVKKEIQKSSPDISNDDLEREIKERFDRFNRLDPNYKDYKGYELTLATSSKIYPSIDEFDVFIPLNFKILETQAAFTIELDKGELVLKDEQRNTVGSLNIKKEKSAVTSVEFIPKRGHNSPSEGELVISQSGKLILKPKQEDITLILGQGFTAYEIDLADWSPIEDQSPGHLCAANAGVALLEFFERSTSGSHLDLSRLFLHKAACNLANLSPANGPSVRSVVAALSVFGVPPEEYWQYDLTKLDEEPPAWCYSYARTYRASSYLGLDRPGMDKTALIAQIKIFVYSGLPVIFGFSVYASVDQSYTKTTPERLLREIRLHKTEEDSENVLKRIQDFLRSQKTNSQLEFDPEEIFNSAGEIPLPTFGEVQCGGHAAVIIGYDDKKLIVNSQRLRHQDRQKLRVKSRKKQEAKSFQGVTRVFSITKDSKFREYIWDDECKGYVNIENEEESTSSFEEFKFLSKGFLGTFILLIREQDDGSEPVLIPRDVLMGFRDSFTARMKPTNSVLVDEYLVTKGAFKIRNSWGKDWGEKGYGWLPYAYVYQNLTFDFWSIMKFEWMNTEQFGLLREQNDLVMCGKDSSGGKC